MADITKCSGINCLKKEQCYRYTAPSSKYWQSWFCDVPIKKGKCDYFYDNFKPVKK